MNPTNPQPRKKIRLGDLLVEHQVITAPQLQAALAEQRKSGRKLGRVLIDIGCVDEPSLLGFLSRQLQIPYIDLGQFKFDPEIVRLIPEIHARRYRALALEAHGAEVVVGMADPTDIFAYDELSHILKRPLRVAVVSESTLLRTFDTVYRRTAEISGFAEELREELSERDVDLGQLTSPGEQSDAPVVKLIQSLFEDALQIGASDIHIEPDETVLRIRQRVDGILQEQIMQEKRIADALVLRLKLVAGLDIAERRLPQDGRFSLKVKGRAVDVRVSTMPVQHGESVVLRLLDQSNAAIELEELGMSLRLRRRFEHVLRAPYGMALVTGPTGSGKTTTLYAALNLLNRPESKIITVEDPVEYRLPRVNQVQVHNDIGLSFARVLRSVLRQDPDIVLVGEMRDQETVEIGVRAALTGHLVLSSLHTNNVVSTVNRLLDMGAERYLLAAALRAIVAQRLVRRICEGCRERSSAVGYGATWLRQVLGAKAQELELHRGAGCPHCGNTGYRGRMGVFELLDFDDGLRDLLSDTDSAAFSQAARSRVAGNTVAQAALAAAAQGHTTLDEVLRIVGGVDETVESGFQEDPLDAGLESDAGGPPAEGWRLEAGG